MSIKLATVNLLDHDDFGIIYKEKDNFYNVVVYYNGEFIEVNVKRITLEVSAKELYPEGYDLNTLFVDLKKEKCNMILSGDRKNF